MRFLPLSFILAGLLAGCAAQPAPVATTRTERNLPAPAANPSVMTPGGY